MRGWVQKILIPLAFMLALSHNILPHHHDEEIPNIQRHHHDDEDDHDKSPFASKFLDHIFLPNQFKAFSFQDCFVANELFQQSIPHPEFVALNSKSPVVFKNEFPPPDRHQHTISRRGPPVSWLILQQISYLVMLAKTDCFCIKCVCILASAYSNQFHQFGKCYAQ